MKRLLPAFLIAVMALCLWPMQAMAAEQNVTYYSDGSYTIVETIQQSSRASKAVTGNKVSKHYDSDGNLKWEATLTGSFTYTGISATCTSASANVTVYDSAWYIANKSTSKSGNVAYASITMNRKVAGVTVKKVSADMSLACSADGKLS